MSSFSHLQHGIDSKTNLIEWLQVLKGTLHISYLTLHQVQGKLSRNVTIITEGGGQSHWQG